MHRAVDMAEGEYEPRATDDEKTSPSANDHHTRSLDMVDGDDEPGATANDQTFPSASQHPTRSVDMADTPLDLAAIPVEGHWLEPLQSDHESVADDAEAQNEPQDLNEYVGDGQTKYGLRQKARELKANFTRTWIDNDKTGLYDPDEEQRKLRQRPKRPKPLLKRGGFRPWNLDESDEESEERRERVPKTVPRLEVILKFKSEDGKAAYEKHVQALPASPEPSEELFSERRLRRRDSGVGFSHSLSAKPTKKKRLLTTSRRISQATHLHAAAGSV